MDYSFGYMNLNVLLPLEECHEPKKRKSRPS